LPDGREAPGMDSHAPGHEPSMWRGVAVRKRGQHEHGAEPPPSRQPRSHSGEVGCETGTGPLVAQASVDLWGGSM